MVLFANRPPLLHRGGFLLYNDLIRNKHLMIEDYQNPEQTTINILDAATSYIHTTVKDKITDLVVEELTKEAESLIRVEVENLLKDFFIESEKTQEIMYNAWRFEHFIYWCKNKETVKKRVVYKSEVVEDKNNV